MKYPEGECPRGNDRDLGGNVLGGNPRGEISGGGGNPGGNLGGGGDRGEVVTPKTIQLPYEMVLYRNHIRKNLIASLIFIKIHLSFVPDRISLI